MIQMSKKIKAGRYGDLPTKKEFQELFAWLEFEYQTPCDLTFHTAKAREDLRRFLEAILLTSDVDVRN